MKKHFKKTAHNKSRKPPAKKVALGIALQGGGSYGAYSKGVLAALLQSKFVDKTDIKIITGTSAGALNGAVLAYGLNKGGPKDAIKHLNGLWSSIAKMGQSLAILNWFDPFSRLAWPNIPLNKMILYQFSQAAMPKGYVMEQLKKTLNAQIDDYDILGNGPTKLIVNTVKQDSQTKDRTHVTFTGDQLSDDTIIASGALEAFGGHEINNETYFDGAYWRNPCFSDIKKEKITDLLVITLQEQPDRPIEARHQDDARSNNHQNPGHQLVSHEIHDHIAYINQRSAGLNLHVISLKVDPRWNETSRANTDPAWLNQLEEMGRKDAEKWLEKGLSALGKRSTYVTPQGLSQNTKKLEL
jgi:NTE family protein